MDWFKSKPKPTEEEAEIFAKLYENYRNNKLPPRLKHGYRNHLSAPNPDYTKYEMLKNKFINNPDYPEYRNLTGGKTRKRKIKRRRTVSR